MTAQGPSTTGVMMQESGAQKIMDYTTVPAGLLIKGCLWTGQETSFTAACPKCGRIGVASSEQRHQRVIVHSGRVDGSTLIGIDYCNLGFELTHGNAKEAYEEARYQRKTHA